MEEFTEWVRQLPQSCVETVSPLRFRSLNLFRKVRNPETALGDPVPRDETEKAARTEAGRSFQETWRPQGDLNPRYRRERAVS